MKTTREQAIQWWSYLTIKDKEFLCIKHEKLLIKGIVRDYKSLTGREIERLYDAEKLANTINPTPTVWDETELDTTLLADCQPHINAVVDLVNNYINRVVPPANVPDFRGLVISETIKQLKTI